MDHFLELKKHLSYVDTGVLLEKISRFRSLNFRNMTAAEISAEISRVISTETPRGLQAILIPRSGTYPAKSRFYRIRKLSSSQLPAPEILTERDAWEPPQEVVGSGRLNRKGESLLYTSPGLPMLAFGEMRIPENEWAALIVYESVSHVSTTQIATSPVLEGLTNEEAVKYRLLTDFLSHEFTRDVGAGIEFLYQISETITKDYFDLPPQFQDAWCYPSVVDKSYVNVCFRPDVAREKLRLLGVQFCKYLGTAPTGLIRVAAIASGFDENGRFLYHAIGSETQMAVFPEISTGKP